MYVDPTERKECLVVAQQIDQAERHQREQVRDVCITLVVVVLAAVAARYLIPRALRLADRALYAVGIDTHIIADRCTAVARRIAERWRARK
jgi:hypothetical protein